MASSVTSGTTRSIPARWGVDLYSQIGDGLVIVGSTDYNTSSGNVTITNVQKY
jgi:hypothetical protein